MKFENIEFYGKDKFAKGAIREIMNHLDHMLTLGSFSYVAIVRYLEVLLDDQDFNPKTKVFYDKVTNRKLNYEFLASVAHDYIFEHADEFKRV